MKRISFAMGLVAATMFAAPLAAQSRNDGPWWDPSNTGTRTDSRTGEVYDRNGSVYGRNSDVYDSRNARVDGQWHLAGRDRNGNNVYVRRRYDNNGNVIQEAAHRNVLGRYSVFNRQVISTANNRNTRNNRVYGRRDNDRNNDGWEDRRSRNDRWDQNNGHDNGRHNGKYKDKKNKNKNRRD
jgi:hypothetical protein